MPDVFFYLFAGNGHYGQIHELTLATSASGIRPDILFCIRLNRVIAAINQGFQYCHFYDMDPTRLKNW